MKDATVLENAATNGNGKHPHPQPYLGHFYVSKPELQLLMLLMPSDLFHGTITLRLFYSSSLSYTCTTVETQVFLIF